MPEPTIIDFLENAFASSIHDIDELVTVRPDEILRRQADVLTLLEDAWQPSSLEQNRAREGVGELWPRLPDVVTDVLTLAKNRSASSLRYGRPRSSAEAVKHDMQALLLYAHGVHVASPLALPTANLERNTRVFLHAVAQLCALAPLIRGEVVKVYEPTPRAAQPSIEVASALEDLKQHLGLALLSFEDLANMNQNVLYEAGAALIDRAASVLLDDENTGANATILFPTRYDKPALDALVKALQSSPQLKPANSHDLRLDLLQRMRLPGLSEVPLGDMVAIRTDDSFGIFRSDVASALNEVDGDIVLGSLDSARRVMAEHMDAGVARLNDKTRKGLLGDVTLSNAITWGIGAAVAQSFAGLQGLIATLVGGASVAFARESPSKGRRALRRHYVELGSSSLAAREDDAIDFATFSTDELWGHHRGRTRRGQRQTEIVDRLLNEFGE